MLIAGVGPIHRLARELKSPACHPLRLMVDGRIAHLNAFVIAGYSKRIEE